MTPGPQINQRDPRLCSKEIMDAVERGTSFVATRDGREIGELIPLPKTQRFVSRAGFVASSARAATVDLERFRAEQSLTFFDAADDHTSGGLSR